MNNNRSSFLTYATAFVGVCGAAAVVSAFSVMLTSPSAEDLRISRLSQQDAKQEAEQILQD